MGKTDLKDNSQENGTTRRASLLRRVLKPFGADSGEKRGLASDVNTATEESLKALASGRPIREDRFDSRVN